MVRTCVFFHAHPDDEALFTSGTMARLAAQGHRVVLVVATAGDQGLAAPESTGGGRLGEVRLAELRSSARALGCARVEYLGYADSGLDGTAESHGPPPFSATPVEEAASRLAAVLTEENADLLTTYDPAGGYGHPDHVRVHHVGARAARLAGTPTVLEATVDRELLLRALRLVGRVHRFPPEFDVDAFERAFSPRAEITHRVDVRRYAAAKRASLAAHATQATGGDSVRTVAALRRLPGPLFRWVLGTEWFVQRDLPPGTLLTDPLAGLPRRAEAGDAR
ncbi:PIG-L deacetylase family protein [Actinopolymorpha pittospori]|uniref:LmbE family N-acetylglucosaminyl deacetylase n=1 Tax=Actinopolymorpha pittospori TaxID=648752 RepID=A0A927RPG9_9ACTN|nr:LmbE family N-acetylglucosaminyl deacetylase [Actinopolymorpha pittospori]